MFYANTCKETVVSLRILILLPLLYFLFFFCNKPAPVVPEATSDWPVSTLGAEGIDSVRFAPTLRYVEDTVQDIYSMVIIRNGRIVLEKYYHIINIDTTYLIRSTTKSIVGALIGIAIRDGLIKDGLNAKILDYFPDKQFENCTGGKQNMTIKDVLTMRTGLEWDDDKDDFFNVPDPVKYILDKPMDTVPGVKWNYNSGASHLLSAILTRESGMSLSDYAYQKLFHPLGIEVYDWQMDCTGLFFGGYGLFLKPKDIAKIGLLYMNQGQWNGTEIVPQEWIAASTDSISSTYWPECGSYGYHWWVQHHNGYKGYGTVGLYGQNMYVIPEKNLIIVFLSQLGSSSAVPTLNRVVDEYILPSVD